MLLVYVIVMTSVYTV